MRRVGSCNVGKFRGWTLLAILLLVAPSSILGEEPMVGPTYEEDLRFLAAHTQVLELTDDHGARIAVCPEYQGRIMTSTCEGMAGASFGWINRAFIAEGKPSVVFNNYGGEDRFWLGPEGGQFALWFAPGVKQEFANWRTNPQMHEGAFKVASDAQTPYYRLTRRMELLNASNNKLTVDVTRDVRLLSSQAFAKSFGEEAASILRRDGVKSVGFASDNTVTNRGENMTREKGLVSIWSLGMFQPGEQTYIIVPYVAGDETELGPIVTADYFGQIPPERLQVIETAILFHGDGQERGKLGVSPSRAKPVLGSIDFASGVLTLVHYTLPDNAAGAMYVNNLWELPQKEPFRGDAVNSYNDGPAEPGAKGLGGFYELETLSPTRPLATGESLRHVHETYHVRADAETLAALAEATLGVKLSDVRAAFAQP
ncbi:MAG: hypothetical protein KF708_14130 [Pirellulales bacterium]|nr:hypothetical protein [Pirellulales bacterium]